MVFFTSITKLSSFWI